MALKAWQDIPDSDVDGSSRFNEALVAKFHDNQEVLISGPVDCQWDEVSGVGAAMVTRPVFIKPAAASTDGDVELVVHLEAWVDAATTGQIRLRLDGGTAADSATFTNTSPAVIEIRVNGTDVRAAAGTVADLTVEHIRTAGAGAVYSRNRAPASRLERVE